MPGLHTPSTLTGREQSTHQGARRREKHRGEPCHAGVDCLDHAIKYQLDQLKTYNYKLYWTRVNNAMCDTSQQFRCIMPCGFTGLGMAEAKSTVSMAPAKGPENEFVGRQTKSWAFGP